jgi:hypothetical protein
MYIKVEGNSDLVRDTNTMAILNTNSNDYENYMRKRQAMMANQEQINLHSEQIAGMQQDLTEIKQMLSALLQDRTKG